MLLRQRANRGDPGIPALEGVTLVAAHFRRRTHAQRDLGDHPERAFAAYRELPQVGPGRGGRCDPEPPFAARSREPHAGHHVLEPAIAGRCLTGRARRRETADRRALEGLRDVAERESVRAEQAFGVRSVE